MNTPLPDGYTLSLVDKTNDIELTALLSTEVHDAGVGEMTRQLAFNHPDTGSMRWLVVRDNTSGDIVSTLCLLPWTILYDGVELPAGELGIVGTQKDHRRLGLVSALTGEFDNILRAEGYLLSHIQGIPWFYRQYGYEYAIPLETKVLLEHRHVARAGARSVIFRKVGEKDIDMLDTFYRKSIEILDVAAARSKEQWSFLLGPSMKMDYAADTYIIEAGGRPVGYCRVPRKGFGEGLILGECSTLPDDCYQGLFIRLKEIAIEAGKPYIRLNLGPSHPAVAAAKELGAQDTGGYAWQIRIPGPAAFLQAIKPSLENRLKASSFASYTGALEINLYRESVSLCVEDGKILKIAPEASDKKAKGYSSINMPPNLFAPLVLGQKTITECAAFYPDLSTSPFAKRLFEALFPPMNGFLHCPY
jgi:hypothetical protein